MRVHQVCLLAAVCLCQTPPSNQTSRPRLRRPRFSAPDIGNAIPHQEPSWYVLHTTELLISSWFCIFALILLVSMFGDEPSGCRASLGTLVLLGASTNGVDSFLANMPRLTTCVYLHYDVQHLLNNSIGLLLAIWFWSSGSNARVETDWMLYWQLPMWWISSVVGALFSYFTILKRALLTIGASGGCFGYSTGWMYVALKATGLDSSERYQRFTLSVMTFGLALLPMSYAGGAESDWMAHGGGAVTGVLVAYCMLQLDAVLGRHAAILSGQVLTGVALSMSALGFLLVFYQGCTSHTKRYRDLRALKVAKLANNYVSQRQSTDGRLEGNSEHDRLLNADERLLDELRIADPAKMIRSRSFVV
ncbi:MAG: hypothetical protein KVP17_000240 [Porospora cf. gigantea B]|uniref:uncharacterized protein n=2 Tax=Porospora cf. gigantea B TaxID=2853592 RepID=UPI003571ED90|nr:MAG: hypothetical protein KVP17_000240 [Porospora cf. gigantea B]